MSTRAQWWEVRSDSDSVVSVVMVVLVEVVTGGGPDIGSGVVVMV